MVDTPTCCICFEDITPSARRRNPQAVCCPHCTFVGCFGCVKQFLLKYTMEPQCPNNECFRLWDKPTQYQLLGKSFVNGPLKERRKHVMLEREKALMPQTIPALLVHQWHAARSKLANARSMRVKEPKMWKQLAACAEAEVSALEAKMKDLGVQLPSHQSHNAASQRTEDTASRFILPCPIDDCRGFISTLYQCSHCDVRLCRRCHEILETNDAPMGIEHHDGSCHPTESNQDDGSVDYVRRGSDAGICRDRKKRHYEAKESLSPRKRAKRERTTHVCDPDMVASAALVKKETRPCPKCQVRIFKIEGCDQMWCTQCHTTFSWRTGQVVTGPVHNPHYHAWRQEQLNAVHRGAATDAPACEEDGISALDLLADLHRQTNFQYKHPCFRLHEVDNFIRLVMEFEDTILRDNLGPHGCWNRVDNTDLRVRYLSKQLSEKGLATQVYKRDNIRCKMEEMRAALQLLPMIVTDTVRRMYQDLLQTTHDMWAARERINEALTIMVNGRVYVNRLMADISQRYQSKVYLYPETFYTLYTQRRAAMKRMHKF